MHELHRKDDYFGLKITVLHNFEVTLEEFIQFISLTDKTAPRFAGRLPTSLLQVTTTY